MPEEMHEVLHPYIHKAQETLDPNYVPHGEHRDVPHTATSEEDSFSSNAPTTPIFKLAVPTFVSRVAEIEPSNPASSNSDIGGLYLVPSFQHDPPEQIKQFQTAHPDADLKALIEAWESIWFLGQPKENRRQLRSYGGII
jgi:hypothetical protein